MRVLFYYGLTVRLESHFFATYSLVYIIVIERTNTAFLRLVIKIELLVSISIFKSTQRYFRISTKAINYAFLLVFFILYLFLQQLLMEIILLNKVHYMAR